MLEPALHGLIRVRLAEMMESFRNWLHLSRNIYSTCQGMLFSCSLSPALFVMSETIRQMGRDFCLRVRGFKVRTAGVFCLFHKVTIGVGLISNYRLLRNKISILAAGVTCILASGAGSPFPSSRAVNYPSDIP